MTANEEELIEQGLATLRDSMQVARRSDYSNTEVTILVRAGWRPPPTGDVADMLHEGLSTEAIRKLEDESYDRGEDAGYTDGYGQGYADGVASAGITCSGVR